MDSPPILKLANQIEIPLVHEPANEMEHERFCTPGTCNSTVVERIDEVSTYSDDNLSKCESHTNKGNNAEKEDFKSAKSEKLPLELDEKLKLGFRDLTMFKNCMSSSENSFQSQSDISENLKMGNQNVEFQSNSQMKIDADNISSDGTGTSSSDTDSSGIENDCAKQTAIGENSKMKGNILDDAPEPKDIISLQKDILTIDSLRIPYLNSSNPFEVVVPLIGKNVITAGNIKPFPHRYDLARARNKAKGQQESPYLPKVSYQEWRKQRDARPQKEKDREIRNDKLLAAQVAAFIIKVSMRISKELLNDEYDEENIEKHFQSFLRVPVSTLALILAPQFIHVMMYIRGSADFSTKLREVANQCYMKCHVMFPIPDGYNFETVYTSEVKKNLPRELDGMHDFILDYGDYNDPFDEDGDSAFSEDENVQLNNL